MSKNLVIVESPAKTKTIKKYLGKDYEGMASYGHVRRSERLRLGRFFVKRHEQESGHRRIAGQGEDDQEVPGQRLRSDGLLRPRAQIGASSPWPLFCEET